MPVFFAGMLGIAIAVVLSPMRAVIPLILLGRRWDVRAVGVAGLSVIVRYLLVPSVMVMVFAAFTVGGWTMLRAGHARAVWALALAVSSARARLHRQPEPSTFNNELMFRGDSTARCTGCSISQGLGRGCAAGRCRCRTTS